MDIPALSMAMAQNDLMTNVNVAVLSKSLDMTDMVGDTITDMLGKSAMEQSVNPAVGSNIDVIA